MVALDPQKVMFTFPDGSKQKTIKDEEMQATGLANKRQKSI